MGKYKFGRKKNKKLYNCGLGVLKNCKSLRKYMKMLGVIASRTMNSWAPFLFYHTCSVLFKCFTNVTFIIIVLISFLKHTEAVQPISVTHLGRSI